MEFGRLDSHNPHDNVFPLSSSSSSLNYTYFSHPSIHYGSWRPRNVQPVVTRVVVQTDVVGLPSAYTVYHRFEQPEMLLNGDRFSPDIRVTMPVQERYCGTGYYYRDIGGFEAVPFRRSVPLPDFEEITGYQPSDMTDIRKEIVAMEETSASVYGRKPKTVVEPLPVVAASNRLSSKKVVEEWRCAVCEISVTSERGLTEHLAGKKHQAKVESLEGHKSKKIQIPETKTVSVESLKIEPLKRKKPTGVIGLGVDTSPVKKQRTEAKTACKGGKMNKKFKFWCKICKIGAYDETLMNDHKKGKKHLKNRKANAKKRFSGRKSS